MSVVYTDGRMYMHVIHMCTRKAFAYSAARTSFIDLRKATTHSDGSYYKNNQQQLQQHSYTSGGRPLSPARHPPFRPAS